MNFIRHLLSLHLLSVDLLSLGYRSLRRSCLSVHIYDCRYKLLSPEGRGLRPSCDAKYLLRERNAKIGLDVGIDVMIGWGAGPEKIWMIG